jgi:hypothetical protein
MALSIQHPPSSENDVETLKLHLLDENNQIFLRMRAVFP